MRRLTTLVVIAAVGLSLSACGRKGKPIPPEGSVYPRTYPNIEYPPGPAGQEPQPQSQPPQQPAPQGRSGQENFYR